MCTFIKKNPSLILFDLSNTRLGELALSKLGRASRKAISMQSLNLSGNPGITLTLLNKIKRMLDADIVKSTIQI
jgi:hypothetical protein